jgi:hypothetical protein
VLWQLDSICFGKWELALRLGMVTVYEMDSQRIMVQFVVGNKVLSSSECIYPASGLVHIKGSLSEGKVAAGI